MSGTPKLCGCGRTDPHRHETGARRHPGRTREAGRFYGSAVWKRVRTHVIQRDSAQCQLCGTETGKMTVHHLVPLQTILDAGGNPADPALLVTLCPSCHGAIDGPRSGRPAAGDSEGGRVRRRRAPLRPAARRTFAERETRNRFRRTVFALAAGPREGDE